MIYYTKDLTLAYITLAQKPVYSQWSFLESKPAVAFTAKAVTVVGQNPSAYVKVQKSSSPTATCIPINKKQ